MAPRARLDLGGAGRDEAAVALRAGAGDPVELHVVVDGQADDGRLGDIQRHHQAAVTSRSPPAADGSTKSTRNADSARLSAAWMTPAAAQITSLCAPRWQARPVCASGSGSRRLWDASYVVADPGLLLFEADPGL